MKDAAAGIIWLLANLLVLTTGYRVSRCLFPVDGIGTTILHVVVLCWACIVGIAVILGLFGVLLPALLLISVSACCVIARIVLWRKTWGTPAPRHGAYTNDPSVRWWSVAWGVLASLLLAHVISDGILSFPQDWDTLAYHLPLIDHWIREGTLYVPGCAFWYCPGNNEVLGLWFVAPFSGDFLIALNNIPAVVLLAAAAVELDAAFGVWRPLCHLSGIAVLATEVTWHQAISAGNDVAAAALFLATLLYVIRYARDRRRADLFFASAAVGLLAGTKYYALGYAGVAGIGVMTLLVACRRPRDAARALAIGLLGVLILGSYWYIRNAAATGAPLYPWSFTESANLWGMIRPESHTSALLRSGRTEVWGLYMDAVRGVGGIYQLSALTLLPITLVWTAGGGFLKGRQSLHGWKPRLWLVMIVVLAGLVCVLTPNVVEVAPGTMDMLQAEYHAVRLTLPFLCLCVVGLAVPLSDLLNTITQRQNGSAAVANHRETHAGRRWLRKSLPVLRRLLLWLSLATVAGTIAYQAATHLWNYVNVDLVLTAWDLFVLGLLLTWSASFVAQRRRITLVLTIFVLAAGGWVCERLAARWHAGFAAAYNSHMFTEAFSTLARVDARRERLCIADNCYYPFFGSRRQYDVCRPLFLPEYEEFLAYLRRHRATMVITCNTDVNAHRRYVDVVHWLGEHPERFEIMDTDRRYTWARVIRGQEEATRGSSPVPNRGGTP